jgi:UDPglucose 6-dehydrogenase
MNICVMGAGYVGICTAVQLAQKGHIVVVVDPDLDRLKIYQSGRIPFYEPGLEKLVFNMHKDQQLHFEKAVPDNSQKFDALFVCVGTPAKSDGKANLDFVIESINSAYPFLANEGLIFIRSSCPPGSYKQIKSKICNYENSLNLIVYPEFLREGSALSDMSNPDRIILGTQIPIEEKYLHAFFGNDSVPIVQTTPFNASMIKYANNALLATLVSFGNAIGAACESDPSGDSNVVFKGVLMDRRWNNGDSTKPPSITSYLNPGLGYGGSCLPKDVSALSTSNEMPAITKQFFQGINATNELRINLVVARVKSLMISSNLRKILIAGIAFKEGTDDLRNSAALKIIEQLSGGLEIYWTDRLVDAHAISLEAQWVPPNTQQIRNIAPDIIIFTNHDTILNNTCLEAIENSHTIVFLARNQELLNTKSIYTKAVGSGK